MGHFSRVATERDANLQLAQHIGNSYPIITLQAKVSKLKPNSYIEEETVLCSFQGVLVKGEHEFCIAFL
jgi:hypothetical protein